MNQLIPSLHTISYAAHSYNDYLPGRNTRVKVENRCIPAMDDWHNYNGIIRVLGNGFSRVRGGIPAFEGYGLRRSLAKSIREI